MITNYEDIFSFCLSATSHVPGFQLSDIATSLLIITHSKKDQAKGKKRTCTVNTDVCSFHADRPISFHLSTDALEKLKSMLQVDYVPSQLAITRLVQALGRQGDLAGISEVQSLMKSLGTTLNLSSMLFVNNKAFAHIKK